MAIISTYDFFLPGLMMEKRHIFVFKAVSRLNDATVFLSENNREYKILTGLSISKDGPHI